jgi:putative NADH-flavin reductase
MKLTIIAATGGIGRQLVAQALAAGHTVTAVVRNPKNLPAGIRVVVTDLAAADPAALESAVAGADAVLSALGARTTAEAEAGVAWRGTQAVVQAMKATKARRIIVVSAAPNSTIPSPGRPNPPRRDPGEGFFMRNVLTPVVKTVLRKHYADLARMEDVLRQSELDWTIVRPPRLTDKPMTGVYRTAQGQNLRGGHTVSRADVAHFMIRAVSELETIRQAIGVAY